ncbi:hypothetical protein LA20533_08355 [Amylolactobacillus amylophilus DSM 20533 = JCM 1125]|uniref:FAD/NAD(P)-binding domain-containing protein n=2 Tax=Lactobacillaceae TaxID=33958 RepID=A0A1L6XA25_9LACO|nr:hypothetical protein LA20533_00185 [Amylolactobacillus amylophilus DSM 20533 = JCM 1125]APT19256.1 hypothetical protein LA20533_08355 [Amylolactobacillus amylophilus DSM 20533 = JCM 1125]GED79757.1 hypothetical protein LAM01_02300 [Amylolactobacillus amylophilus]
MFYETPEHLASIGAKVKTMHDVLKINPKEKSILVQDMSTKKVVTDTYDKLIMSTGSYVQVPPLTGIDNDKVLLCMVISRQKQSIIARKTTSISRL